MQLSHFFTATKTCPTHEFSLILPLCGRKHCLQSYSFEISTCTDRIHSKIVCCEDPRKASKMFHLLKTQTSQLIRKGTF